MITNIQWRYFLSIDEDLQRISRYIEFSSPNYEVYSVELVRLYLSVCSEVDSLMKKVCITADKESYNKLVKGKNPTMDIYRTVICKAYPLFHTIECPIPEYQLTFRPWESFKVDKNPGWWRDHNDVKHDRDNNYKMACLRNVLEAAAGLLALFIYDFAGQKWLIIDDLIRPKIFEIPPDLRVNEARWGGTTLITPEQRKAEQRA